MLPFGSWRLAQTAPGAWRTVSDAPPEQVWFPAPVPGTVASALVRAGRWKPEDDIGFDAFDFWYATTFDVDEPSLLRFEGLATMAEVHLDGTLVLQTCNMFRGYECSVPKAGSHTLVIAFRSLDAYGASRKGRARWRPRLARPASLRYVRTMLLGHIPGWGPAVHAVGPYRAVTVHPEADVRIRACSIRTRVEGADGLLDLAVRLSRPVPGWITARCGAVDFALVDRGDGLLCGSAVVPDVELWWPHTHGEPRLYPIRLFAGEAILDLGATGFRTVALDRDQDGQGFGLVVNGVPVFCRGACWTTADIVALPFSRKAIEPLLLLARDAGMNMIRVGGTMGYESDAFYALCDELGLLVWQDFAFSNFDYPAADAAFAQEAETEARHLLERLQASPSLAVLCGASEVAQQAAMFGMPPALWSNALFDDLLRSVAEEMRPDVLYTPHSPWGGPLPFVADHGISHYYGISAHLRPIEDARRAAVRFSAESLGFANIPDLAPFELEPHRAATRHADTVERVAHDHASAWAFEAVRNTYTESLYGIDVEALRRDDLDRFLHYARATSAEVMEATYAEWRRQGSVTRGALVWFLRDVFPGASWGVIDETGAPKAAYWGLKRAFRPLTVVLTDEGLNGCRASVTNETVTSRRVRLRLVCLRGGDVPVIDRSTDPFDLPPHSSLAFSDAELVGGFFDTTFGFRFGPPSHDVVAAILLPENDPEPIAASFLFPLGRNLPRAEIGLAATIEDAGGSWQVSVRTDRFAHSVRIAAAGYCAVEDNYFNLMPGEQKTITLRAVGGGPRPSGTAMALNAIHPAPFAAP